MRASGSSAAAGARSGGGPARLWRCGPIDLDLGRARVMGVVNVTPDSFSDGGEHATCDDAVAWGLQLLDEGADILDVGGESTRPGFQPVSIEEEERRVLPVIERLAARGALVSVDTRHAEVARDALAAGAAIVNDVSGFEDPTMVDVAARSACGCVAMHAATGFLAGTGVVSREVPADPDEFAAYVRDYLVGRAAELEAAGVAPARIAIDPGPGFGTVPAQDIAVQRSFSALSGLGYPLVCAVSRKRFVGAVSGANPARARDAASTGVALAAVARGARVVRAHNVAQVAEALRAAEACADVPVRRRALVALGANLGDRATTLRDAAVQIGALPLTRAVAGSRIYETEPAYRGGQPAFANAVLEVETGLHPRALLEALLGIEERAGRVRTVENGPRTLDLDLLWMEGERHAGSRLTLPHPLMGERAFVLRPLADVVGDARAFCAGIGVRVAEDGVLVGAVTGELGGLL